MATASTSQLPPPAEIINEFGDKSVISWSKLIPAEIESYVHSPAAGAVVSFVGYTRNSFQGKVVTHLEYEGYTPLALKTINSILLQARALPALPASPNSCCHSSAEITENDTIKVEKMVVYHLLGNCGIGEASLVISVSSSHRKEAFYICEWILERIKEKVEIWKREFYLDEEGQWKVNTEATVMKTS